MSRKTRKLIWSAPLVAVLAVAGALTMFAALGPGSVFANPLPGVPMNVDANPASGVAGRTTLVVTWDPVADAAGYRIDVSDNSFVWETRVTSDDPHTSTTYTDDTLYASNVRWYRVFAVNDHGEGPVSDPAEGMTNAKGKPGPVRNFTATAMGQRQINLSWDPPADNGGAKITGYEIQYYNTAVADPNWYGLRTDVAGTEDGGDDATDYLVVNADDYMENGGHADKHTLADATATPAIFALHLDPGEMRSYRIRALNGDLTALTADDRTDAEAPNTMDGWVRDSATTAAATPPTPPTGLTAVNTGTADGNIALYWFAPEIMNNGGWPVTDYLIQVRRAGSNEWPEIPDADALKVLTISDKAGGAIPDGDDANTTAGSMNFRVSVDETYTATQKTFATVPTTWDHDGDDADEDGNKDGVTPTTPATPRQPLWLEFRVFAMTTDDGVNDTDDDADAAGDDDTLIIGTMPSETSGRVRAVLRPLTDADGDDPDGDGQNDQGETATAVADAYGPPTLFVTGSDAAGDQPGGDGPAMEQEIQIALQKPAGVGIQNIYRIDYSEDAGNTWNLLTGRTTFTGFDGNRRFQHRNLPPQSATRVPFDADIEYRAFALRSNWRTTAGPVSTMVDGTTTASTAPGKVTGVMASSPNAMTIEASWSAPEEDGGQPIVKYQYEYVRDDNDGEADAGDWATTNPHLTALTDIPQVTTEDAGLMVTNDMVALTKGELYHIRVRAVNKEAGERTDALNTTQGPWSDAASFIAGGANPPNMVEGITSEMAKDGTGTITERGVDVLWNAPSEGADVDHYVIERSVDMGTTWETLADDDTDAPASRTAYTDPRHYEMGETLVYRVAAENAAGKSPWATVDYPREPAAHMDHMLGDASGLMAVNNGDGTVTLTWTPGPNSNIHWVAAARRDGADFDTSTGSTVWEKADMPATHTVDVSNLTAGTYAFTVIAGQYDPETGDENWDTAWTPFADVTAP